MANSYGNLGNTNQGLGEFKRAITHHQRHLQIAKEVGERPEREEVIAISATLMTV